MSRGGWGRGRQRRGGGGVLRRPRLAFWKRGGEASRPGCQPSCAAASSQLYRRRDLEAARTLADQVRKREKLKRRELQLYKEEWAARMQGECAGSEWAGRAGGGLEGVARLEQWGCWPRQGSSCEAPT